MTLKFSAPYRLTGVITLLVAAVAVFIALRHSQTADLYCPKCGFKALVKHMPIVNFFVIHRESSINSRCVTTLRQLDGAKQQWALEEGQPPEALPTWRDIAPYFLHRDEDGAFEPAAIPLHLGATWPAEWISL